MTRSQQPMDVDEFLAKHASVQGRFVSRVPPSIAPDPAAAPVPAGKRDEVSRGRRATNAGKMFEQQLAWAHRYYAQARIAQIYKAEVPTQAAPRHLLSRQASYGMVRIFSARAKPDYYGAAPYSIDGRRFAIPLQMEAKSNGEYQKSIRIRAKGEKEHGVKEAQLETLVTDWRRFGTLGVLVWLNGEHRMVFMPDALDAAWEGFRTGAVDRLHASDATLYRREMVAEFGYIEHWLGIVLKWWENNQAATVQRVRVGEETGESADSWSQGLGKTA